MWCEGRGGGADSVGIEPSHTVVDADLFLDSNLGCPGASQDGPITYELNVSRCTGCSELGSIGESFRMEAHVRTIKAFEAFVVFRDSD